MKSTDRPLPLENEVGWLCRLARSLRRSSAADADDLAQDALLAALRSRPAGDRSLRGWLATALRNLVRQGHRAAERRARRERAAAEPEALPSAADLVLRLHARRRVLDALEALAEPYRETLLLCYFEGLSPAAIAAKKGVPLPTVRSRLARGQAKLRERLDREFGAATSAWLLAVAPFSSGSLLSVAAASTLAGVTIVNAKLAVAVAAVLVTGSAAVFWPSSAADPPPTAPALPKKSAPGPAEAPALALAEEAAREVATATEAPSTPAGAAGAASPADVIAVAAGQVLDCDGMPLGGFLVAFVADGAGGRERAIARSDGAGRFEVALPHLDGRLLAAEPGFVTVFSTRPGGNGARDCLVVAAPAVAVAGAVVDAGGAPLANASVAVDIPDAIRRRVPAALSRSRVETFEARSDGSGRFDLGVVPSLAEARINAVLTGYARRALPVPREAATDLEIVLERPATAGPILRGKVVDPTGAAVAGAFVSAGRTTAETDSLGLFELPARFDPEESSARVFAVKEGFGPARAEAPLAGGTAAFPDFLVLELAAEAGAISGLVLGPDGQPFGAAQVWIADPTHFGYDGASLAVLLENLLAPGEEGTFRKLAVRADGTFTIDGLDARSYEVAAVDPESMLFVRRAGVPAGTRDVVLRLPADGLYPLVSGRVIGRTGAPVAGAQVRATRDLFFRPGGIWMDCGARAVTDPAGAFELTGVPKDGVYLRVDGDGIEPTEFAHGRERLADEAGRVEGLEIVVTRCLDLALELLDAAEADEFAVVDADGTALNVAVVEEGGRSSNTHGRLVEGRSGVVQVPETGATVVLYRADAEIRRLPLVFAREGVTIIRG